MHLDIIKVYYSMNAHMIILKQY